jgi:hypothetical protein
MPGKPQDCPSSTVPEPAARSLLPPARCDGGDGVRVDRTNMAEHDDDRWQTYCEKLEQVARESVTR